MKKNYTLKEIAKELNVSRATIDRVIYNRGGIGDDTTKRVREFLDKVDYRPNRIGKGLAKRLQKNIYVIFHDIDNEFFIDVKRGVLAAESDIKDFGFNVRVIAVKRNLEEQIRIMKNAVDEGANAIAVSPYEPDGFGDIIDDFIKKGIPIITFNNDIVNSSRLCYIGTNYWKSGRIAGEVLGKIAKKGKIAIQITSNYWQSLQRMAGFREILDGFQDIQIIGPFKNLIDFDSSYNNTKKIIESVSDLKGIYVVENEKGVLSGICRAINDFAVQKVDVVTFDLNSESIEELKKGFLTAAICQDPFSQGYYSVKVLFNCLFDNKLPRMSSYLTRLDVIYRENLENYDNNFEHSFFKL